MKIKIINGPNLNLLGMREPDIYGSRGFDGYLEELRVTHPAVEILYFQSNIEGELIDALHASSGCDGVVANFGGYTHTSIALADAIAAISTPVIEVHISNIFAREDFRHTSYPGAKCKGSISGLGLDGYRLALEHLVHAAKKQ